MPIDRNLEKGLVFIEKTVKQSAKTLKQSEQISRTDKLIDTLVYEEQSWFDTQQLVDDWFKENDDGYDHFYYNGKLYKLKRD